MVPTPGVDIRRRVRVSLRATARTLARLTRMVQECEPACPLRFTAALADGRDLYAFRYAINDRANTLYYQSSSRGAVVVSEPLDREHANWHRVPENRVLLVRSGRPVEIIPFLESPQLAAE